MVLGLLSWRGFGWCRMGEACDVAVATTSQLEEVKREGEEDDFVAAKQKMLNAEKGRIQ